TAVFMGNDIVGIDVMTLDLDAVSSTAPPNLRLQTPTGRGADLNPSVDNGLFTTNLRGLDVGALDCSDYGIYELRTFNLSARREGPNDLNIFTSQITGYGAGVVPATFPVAAGDPADPARLYYPRDDGTPPRKER